MGIMMRMDGSNENSGPDLEALPVETSWISFLGGAFLSSALRAPGSAFASVHSFHWLLRECALPEADKFYSCHCWCLGCFKNPKATRLGLLGSYSS